MITVHTNCRHYRVSRPCEPHKRSQVRCDECGEYSRIDERILIVKLDAIGDVLRTTMCLEPLKRLFPCSHVTWVTRASARPLLEGNPAIDRVLTVESNYLEFLLAEEFDLALSPDADPLSASILTVANATTRLGFVADRRGGVIPLNEAARQWWAMGLDDRLKRENRKTYGEWLYAVCELPAPPIARPSLPLPRSALDDAATFLRSRAPDAARFVCLNTGASSRWQEKRWKAVHYRELARRIRDRARDTAVVLVGGPDEADLNADLLSAISGVVDGGTDNSLEGFAALIACCDWVLTPDSLGYHVACAVETPAVCVVGPTSPWELDLFGTNRVLHADLDCIACYLAKCPFATTCMDTLTPDVVWPHVTRDETTPAVARVVAMTR